MRIGPLRRQLPEAGWHSLSLQLPHSEAPQPALDQLDASRQRIAEALAELERRAILNIVIILVIIAYMLPVVYDGLTFEEGLRLDLLLYIWTGAIIIYLIFGGYWVIRKYNEREYRGEF